MFNAFGVTPWDINRVTPSIFHGVTPWMFNVLWTNPLFCKEKHKNMDMDMTSNHIWHSNDHCMYCIFWLKILASLVLNLLAVIHQPPGPELPGAHNSLTHKYLEWWWWQWQWHRGSLGLWYCDRGWGGRLWFGRQWGGRHWWKERDQEAEAPVIVEDGPLALIPLVNTIIKKRPIVNLDDDEIRESRGSQGVGQCCV